MNRFLDTAAMYSLFRVVDDYVDTKDSSAIREKNILDFEKNFWLCYKKKQGDYNLHPILPAVIETINRRKYAEKLFKKFFKSMKKDIYYYKC